ncbi:MAG TPA: MarR family transcriptional regulator [Methanosarcinaceae archaeon]|nr:MarR family transcriptional regulator [Methanosarcinaceae archaeon]
MAEEYAKQLFLQEKPTLALLAISSSTKTYASVITKEINSTFAHTTKILSKMKEHGLVEFTVEGRVKYVELTDHGMNVVGALKNLIIAIGEEPGAKSINASVSPDKQSSTSEMSDTSSSQAIQKKIDQLSSKIESIYDTAIENGADKNAMSLKLGPFNRDIAMTEKMIESSNYQIDESVINSLNDVRARIESILNQ